MMIDREVIMSEKTIDTKYSAKEIQRKIENDDRWLERGILAIYRYQVADEKQTGEARYHNKVGFSGAHASFLTYCAKWIQSGKHLNGRFKNKARKFMTHYSKQLEKIANGEQATA